MKTTLVLALALVGAPAVAQGPALTVYSAGSAKGVLTAILARYTQETGVPVTEVGGPAGGMLARIEAGEAADVFVSANMGYARKLAADGKGTAAVVFARNALCVSAVPAVGLTKDNILDRLLDPAVRIVTSDPANDPSGQYAFAVFDKAGALRPGAGAMLKAKARIAGAPAPAKGVPASKLDAAQALAARGGDATIGFCSSTGPTPDQSVTRIALPPELSLPVAYGMSVVTVDPAQRAAAQRLAAFLLGAEAQAILPTYGFAPAGAGRAADKDQL